MSPTESPETPAPHSPRQPAGTGQPASPAEAARERLLKAGLRLFAQHGYSKTSTRELAEAANVNVAAISYYFGDKAGLYRAVFFEPMGGAPAGAVDAACGGAEMGLEPALRCLYDGLLAPLKQGDTARLCMKLRFREMLEPTGLWAEELAQGIQPMHNALVEVLSRHYRVDPAAAAADADLQRLAICLAGLGVHMHVGRDVSEQVAPGLMDGAEAIDLWRERLVLFGLAMVRAEGERRGLTTHPLPATVKSA